MFQINPLRKRQFYGILTGLILAIAAISVLLFVKPAEEYISIGPMNTGHEGFSCNTCHADAKGNWIQQIQSNTEQALGMREKMVAFGSLPADTKKCLACHERDNDRHPTYRFLEPKHQKAIKKIDATNCATCHTEHNGIRITLANGNYCMNCHTNTKVKNDPVDTPHSELFKKGMWSTCLQCHDFHGNHQAPAVTLMKDTIPMATIKDYFMGGKDPYVGKKKFKALTEQEWIQKYVK